VETVVANAAQGEPTIILHHGTTRWRALRIVSNGPDPDYHDQGEVSLIGFSMAFANGPYPMGAPERYARGKAAKFKTQGGPVMLEIEMPLSLAWKAMLLATSKQPNVTELEQAGEVFFQWGKGLEDLLAAWPTLPMRLIDLS
jgi:hypothetical protein